MGIEMPYHVPLERELTRELSRNTEVEVRPYVAMDSLAHQPKLVYRQRAP